MKRPLVPLTLAFILGLVLGRYFDVSSEFWLLALVAALATGLALVRWSPARAPVLALVLVAAAAAGALRWDAWQSHSLRLARESRFFATLDPGRVEGTLLECLSSRERATWRVVDIAVTVGRRTYPFKGHAMVHMSTPTAEELRPGERLAWQGGLAPIRASGLPGQPDWPDYYAARNLSARLWQRGAGEVERLGRVPGGRFRLEAALLWARARLDAGLSRRLPPESASLANAMLLGELSGFTPQRLEALRTSGLFHLTCVSGLHVMGLVVGMLWTLRRLGLRRRTVALLALPVILAFVLLVGARAPAVRAGLMAALLLSGWLLDRETDALNLLALAAFLNLLAVPHAMLEAGFQLSYLTVAILILASPLARRWQAPHRAWLNALRQNLLVSTAATATTAPLLLYHFGRASLLPIASNLIALPMVLLVMPLGLLFNLAALCSAPGPLLAALALPLRLGFGFLGAVINLTGHWTWAVLGDVSMTPATLAALLLLLATLVGGVGKLRGLRRPRLVTGLAIVALAVWMGAFTHPRAGLMQAQFLALGQGDATLLFLPYGGTALVDGGPGDPDHRPSRLLEYLKRQGITRLDLVVLTHPEEDHIGDLPRVLESLSIGALASSGKSKATRIFARLDAVLEEKAIPHLLVGRGDRITGFPGVELHVLSPSPGLLGGSANRASVVLRVDYGEIELLLTGDVDRVAERDLVEAGLPLEAEILKVAHHGSRTSSSLPFLLAVRPQLAVIMCGRNPYGHPHPEVVHRLQDLGAVVVRTDRAGSVILKSDGRRYWMGSPRSPARYAGEPEETDSLAEGEYRSTRH